ncbi:hypothetical protein Q4503_06600 [Colwellia sp. 6_MG-2023]|uniref:hypothetical protein n=1 Tax=Colwellia sp. 6_MG-2023 TaxID=3062676 RepID=UPI0026E2BE9E|nr:hypothetical protein [Colwellia sp. 6_MG-2023]MDO6487363.1 hypothetical protein [Colwellia sp. 6_MG-2023]
MLIRILMTFMLASLAAVVFADTLKPFTSDGCSAFPDGTFAQKKLWLTCCQRHDFDYWQGGTYQQRLASDNRLKMCVTQVGEPTIAALMLAGVRVGGTPYLPTSFRWGYGWSYPRFYGALSVEELRQVQLLSTDIVLNVN